MIRDKRILMVARKGGMDDVNHRTRLWTMACADCLHKLVSHYSIIIIHYIMCIYNDITVMIMIVKEMMNE
jgi:hypothetical protein